MNIKVGLRLPSEAESVSLIRDLITRAMLSLGVGNDSIADVVLGLSEACTNVVDHALVDDDYEIELELVPPRCVITITDSAGRLDTEAVRGELPADSSEHGRGLAIMRAVMDRVDFEIEPGAGTIVRLVKDLDIEPGGPLDRLS